MKKISKPDHMSFYRTRCPNCGFEFKYQLTDIIRSSRPFSDSSTSTTTSALNPAQALTAYVPIRCPVCNNTIYTLLIRDTEE